MKNIQDFFDNLDKEAIDKEIEKGVKTLAEDYALGKPGTTVEDMYPAAQISKGEISVKVYLAEYHKWLSSQLS